MCADAESFKETGRLGPLLETSQKQQRATEKRFTLALAFPLRCGNRFSVEDDG
jgi:hypothetical protein